MDEEARERIEYALKQNEEELEHLKYMIGVLKNILAEKSNILEVEDDS